MSDGYGGGPGTGSHEQDDGTGIRSNGHAAVAAPAQPVAAGVAAGLAGSTGAVPGPAAAGVSPSTTDGDGGHMTIFEHLAELRRRILICAVAVVVTSVAGWFLYGTVLHFMLEPYRAYFHNHPGKLLSSNLVARTPVEGFTTRLKVASYIGLALAAPIWLWQVWRFITPGLRRKEKQYAVPFVTSALVLFSLGVTVAILVWPKALTWLIGVSGSGVSAAYTPSAYVSIYLLICLVFGVVFLYPIVVVFLMISGVVPTRKWRQWRRPAIVVLCTVAAVVTPSNDPITFMGMAIPMIIFYELSILLGRLLRK